MLSVRLGLHMIVGSRYGILPGQAAPFATLQVVPTERVLLLFPSGAHA